MDNARKVLIAADSTCDLTKEQTEKYNIAILPLYVRLGDEEHLDGIDIKQEDLFAYVARTGILPKTAACSVSDYQGLWTPYVEKGYDIVHLTISSEMSACYQNACTAAETMNGHVYPIDSRNLSTGIGQLAIEGAVCRDKGMSAKEIYDYLEVKKNKLNVSFVIDTMEYLAKGGRCSSVVALVGSLMRIKPCIEVKNGKMGVCKKYRGRIENAFKQYIHERLQAVNEVDSSRIFITYSPMDTSVLPELHDAINAEKQFGEILESVAGCTICSHCGPGTMGILFFEA